MKTCEDLDRVAAHDAIEDEADVELEISNGLEGLWSVDPVVVAAAEPEPVQASLQLPDVVSVQERACDEQHAVPEAVGGRDQGPPGVLTDDAVRLETSGLLERADGGLRGVTEDTSVVVARETELR